MARNLILLSLLFAAACSGPAVHDQGSPASPSQGGTAGETTARETTANGAATGVRLARLPESRLGDAAALTGTLRTEGPCLYLEAGGAALYLIAFTVPGARWDEARGRLIVPSGSAEKGEAAYRPGERVTLGGSEAQAATLSNQWVEPPAAACDTRRIWIASSVTPSGSD